MLPQIFILLCVIFIQERTCATPPIQNFADLTKQPFFVDKTEYIKTFFEDDHKHVFITAPRGFGKTTSLQMLRAFCEIELDSDHRPKLYTSTTAYQTFRHLKIANYTNMLEKHMARYVVIYLDLESDATMGETIDLNKTVTFFNKKLHQSFEPYKWLLDESNFTRTVSASEIDSPQKLQTDLRKLSKVDSNQTTFSLYEFANISRNYFGKDVIILIDNYDSVLNNFFRPTRKDIETFYEYVSDVLTNTFDNKYPATSNGLIMGTSSLVLPHILLTLSEARHYNFLNDHRYTVYYGFTDPEATNLLLKYNCSMQRRQQVRKYYNGYKSKTKMITIYNPSSMVNYLTNIDNPEALKPYRNITNEDNFLLSFKQEKVFRHLVENMLNNMTTNFDQFESFSMSHFTTFFNKCESYEYKAAEVEMMFSYIFDQGYLSHGIDQPVAFVTPNKVDSIVHIFTAPNLEVWLNVKEIATIIGPEEEEEAVVEEAEEAMKLPSNT